MNSHFLTRLDINCAFLQTGKDWVNIETDRREEIDFSSKLHLQIKTKATTEDQLASTSLLMIDLKVYLQNDESGQTEKEQMLRLRHDRDEYGTSRMVLEICNQAFPIAVELVSDINFRTENIWTYVKNANSLELLHGQKSLIEKDFDTIGENCLNDWTGSAVAIVFRDSNSPSIAFRPAISSCYEQFVKIKDLDKHCEQIESSKALNQFECGQEALVNNKDGYFAWYSKNEDPSCWKCPDSSELVGSLSDDDEGQRTSLVKNSCVGELISFFFLHCG